MVFDTSDILGYEVIRDEILEQDKNYTLNLAEKIGTVDVDSYRQRIFLLKYFEDIAIEHKRLVLEHYKNLIDNQLRLIEANLRIIEAGAGNISPAGNLTALLQLVIGFINIGTYVATLGTYQGEYLRMIRKPLFMFISEIAQDTNDLYNDNLATAYDTLQRGIVLPHLLLRL